MSQSDTFSFVECSCSVLRSSLRIPFRHALANRRESDFLRVELRRSDGKIFFGDVFVRPYLTGETLKGAQSFVEGFFTSHFKGRIWRMGEDPLPYLSTLWHQTIVQENLAAFAGLDTAIYHAVFAGHHWHLKDAEAQGLVKARRVLVLPFLPPVFLLILSRISSLLGWLHLKVKVSPQRFPPTGIIKTSKKNRLVIFDANTSLDSQSWAQILTSLRPSRKATLIWEEPFPSRSWELYREIVTEHTVMFDESICSLADATQLGEHFSGQKNVILNLRLAKNGGITGVRILSQYAKKQSWQIYAGCLVGETSGNLRARALLLDTLPFVGYDYSPKWLLSKPKRLPFQTGLEQK